jgi:hypothetical protein
MIQPVFQPPALSPVIVAQVSKPAVSPVSKPAGRGFAKARSSWLKGELATSKFRSELTKIGTLESQK